MLPVAVVTQDHYSKEEIEEDLDSLCVFINDIHPGMFSYTTQEEFEKKVAEVRSNVTDGMTRLDTYKLFAPLVASLGDGHTYVSFPYGEVERPGVSLFPVTVTVNYQDSTLFVKNGTGKLPDSAAIVSINGNNSRVIVGEMMEYVSGERKFYRAATVSRRFGPLLYALRPGSVYTVEYLEKGLVKAATLAGIPYAELVEIAKGGRERLADHDLRIDGERKTATMELNSFEDFPGFTAFADSSFTVIRENGIGDLIIDVRRNGGGDSRSVDELFQYISTVPFAQMGKLVEKRSNRQIKWIESTYGIELDSSYVPGILTFDAPPLHELRDNPNRFAGNVYVLTSHSTFSAAADFAWTFSQLERGPVIGEETGGLAVCFGAVIPQVLPNTGLELGISSKKFYAFGADENDIHGALPDHQVAAGQALEYAGKLIEAKRQE